MPSGIAGEYTWQDNTPPAAVENCVTFSVPSRSILRTSAPIRLHIDGNFDSNDHATRITSITPASGSTSFLAKGLDQRYMLGVHALSTPCIADVDLCLQKSHGKNCTQAYVMWAMIGQSQNKASWAVCQEFGLGIQCRASVVL